MKQQSGFVAFITWAVVGVIIAAGGQYAWRYLTGPVQTVSAPASEIKQFEVKQKSPAVVKLDKIKKNIKAAADSLRNSEKAEAKPETPVKTAAEPAPETRESAERKSVAEARTRKTSSTDRLGHIARLLDDEDTPAAAKPASSVKVAKMSEAAVVERQINIVKELMGE